MHEWSHSIGVVDETVKVAKEYLDFHPNLKDFSHTGVGKFSKECICIANFLGWNLKKVGHLYVK